MRPRRTSVKGQGARARDLILISVRIRVEAPATQTLTACIEAQTATETAKRIAAEAVMDSASELHKRLQIAAPVVAAGIACQPQIARLATRAIGGL